MDLQNILFQRASRICFSLLDHVSAGSGVLDFDTTSSVAGGTFVSNISLVDPTIQFSRTEKRLVEQGVSFTTTQSKIHFYIHFHLLLLLPIIKGSGYGLKLGFGDNIHVRYIIPLLYMQQWCLSFILYE